MLDIAVHQSGGVSGKGFSHKRLSYKLLLFPPHKILFRSILFIAWVLFGQPKAKCCSIQLLLCQQGGPLQ